MKRFSASKPVGWYALAALALLGMVFLLGVAIGGLTLLESIAALGFLAAVVLLAWLWRLTVRWSEAAPVLTGWRWAWNAAVFVAWLAAMAWLAASWFWPGREGERPQRERETPEGIDAQPGPRLNVDATKTGARLRLGCCSLVVVTSPSVYADGKFSGQSASPTSPLTVASRLPEG